MKVNREQNVLEYSSKTANLENALTQLASKDSKAMAKFLVEKTSLPRELRTNALRYVLNDYVKMAKELVLSDEFMYRLNWYEKFSEFQLINFWNVLKTKNSDKFNEKEEIVRYKKTFYLLLLLNADRVGFLDSMLDDLLNTYLPLDLDENFQEFMQELDPVFYDYECNFDGLSYEDFKTNLKKSSTVADIRNIASKYDIQVPKRLKKDEFVALVADGLRRQGKYDQATEEKLRKMSAISLQRFAKVNHIKASTEMKKDDIIDFIMNRIEMSPKAVHKPRIQLVSIPELEEFQFSSNYLRDVKAVVDEEDEEDDFITPPVDPIPEPEPVPAPAPEPEPVEEPIIDDANLDELVSQLDTEIEELNKPEEPEPAPIPEPMPTPEPEPTPAPAPAPAPKAEPEKDYTKELDALESRTENVYSDELLQTIVRILEERDSKDTVTELLEDNRFNSVMKIYEERIAYLEKMIEEMRTTPVPINIQVTYPENMPVAPAQTQQTVAATAETVEPKEPIGNEETQILDETPEEELEQAPEVFVSETSTVEEPSEEPVVEPVEPTVYDVTFDGLSESERMAVADERMVASLEDEEEFEGLSEKEAEKLAKLKKKKAKIERMREANDRAIYRRHKRRKFWRVIGWIFWILVILFVALNVICFLIDNGTIKGSIGDNMNKYISYIPGFAKDNGVIRINVGNFIRAAINWITGLFKKN